MAILALGCALCAPVAAEEPAAPMPSLSDVSRLAGRIGDEAPETFATPIKVLLLLTLLSVIPSVLILTTAFTRIVIVLAFIRQALTTRNIPPGQVVVGLALFLSLFVMAPTLARINAEALQPYLSGSMPAEMAIQRGTQPLRDFMFGQAGEGELLLFLQMSGAPEPSTPADVPTYVLIPAFVVSELKTAFQLGFVLFLPFLVVDLIVASVLLSMGMIMLPPVMISAPLKILLFVLVDGWRLITESLIFSFGGA
ncbi:MAG: flagellar biosynthesis protein flip [Planctomycetes bacterium SM23_32]|nr:MAG: flagellar biosynthesis protein flip [Planctomycetes bacterium SM23_32]